MRKLKTISFLAIAFLITIQCLFIKRDNPLDPNGDDYTGTGTGTSTGTGTGTGTGSGLSIVVTDPPAEGATANKVYIIGWDYSAEGTENPFVTLYYDTDTLSGGETLIIKDVKADNYSYVWDCSDVKSGTYYILAVLDDGNGLCQRNYVRVNTVREKHIQPKGADLKQPQAIAKDYSDGALVINHSGKDPSITVTAPPAQGETTDKSYIIRWTYTSQGSDPKVELYYDTDTDPNNGREYITSDIDASDMSYSWDCSSMPNGDYYIMAIIEDGVGHKNAVYINSKKVTNSLSIPTPLPYMAYDYSDGKLKIKHSHQPPTISVTDPPSQGAEADRSYTIRWSFTSEGSSPTVALYFDNDTNSNNGKTKIADSIPASDLLYGWDCSAIPEGSYYILAVIDDNLGSSSNYKRIEKQKQVTLPFYIIPPIKGKEYVGVPTTAEDYSDGKLTISHYLLATLTGHNGSVNSVMFNPTNGSRCMSGSSDNNLKYWDLSTGSCIRTFYGHKKTVNSVFISPNGLNCFSGSDADPANQSLKYWDIDTGNAQTFDSSEQTNLAVAICREGTYGLVGHFLAVATLWNLEEAKTVVVFQGHINAVYTVAFGLTYRDIFTGSGDKTIVQWYLNGTNKQTFMGHTGPVRSIVISYDGNILVSGSEDKTIRIWDIPSGQIKSTINTDAGVQSVAISKDGKYILSGGDDKNMKLWDFNTKSCIKTFTGHTASVMSVAFSPDGKRALSASKDNTIKYWKVL